MAVVVGVATAGYGDVEVADYCDVVFVAANCDDVAGYGDVAVAAVLLCTG